MPKKSVKVRSYKKKDGTQVKSHNRSKPKTTKRNPSPNIIPNKDIIIGLEMIAKYYGEEEFDDIPLLEKEHDIIVTGEIAPPMRANQIAVYVLEGYDKGRYASLKSGWSMSAPAHLVDRYITLTEINGKTFIKYPYSVNMGDVNSEILEDLKYGHDIDDTKITTKQWESIMSTKQYKDAQKQVAREQIAIDITKRFNY